MILSNTGITASSDNTKHHGKFGEKISLPSAIGALTEVDKSICWIVVDPRNGSSPIPEIFSQPMSFNTFSRLTASIDTRISEMSLSVNFDAKSLPMSPKSSVSESKHAGRDSADTIIARDEFGRFSPMNRRIESGRLLIDKRLLCWALLPSWPWALLLLGVAMVGVFVDAMLRDIDVEMLALGSCHSQKHFSARKRNSGN